MKIGYAKHIDTAKSQKKRGAIFKQPFAPRNCWRQDSLVDSSSQYGDDVPKPPQ